MTNYQFKYDKLISIERDSSHLCEICDDYMNIATISFKPYEGIGESTKIHICRICLNELWEVITDFKNKEGV